MATHLVTTIRRALTDRDLASQRGEGVISTGIAVLIMALLGATLWWAFSQVINTASGDIQENVECVTANTCTNQTGD